MASKKFEAIFEILNFALHGETKTVRVRKIVFRPRSKPDVRNIAVANGDFGIGQKQAVDSGQQAAQQGADGRKGDSGGLGHLLSPVAGTQWSSRRLQDT